MDEEWCWAAMWPYMRVWGVGGLPGCPVGVGGCPWPPFGGAWWTGEGAGWRLGVCDCGVEGAECWPLLLEAMACWRPGVPGCTVD